LEFRELQQNNRNPHTPNTNNQHPSSPNYQNLGQNHNPNLNRINLLKQKYVNNNGILSVGQMAVLRMKVPDMEILPNGDKFPSSRRVQYEEINTGGS
jgi:hypothetical protein